MWSPGKAPETLTAAFEMVADDPADHCPTHPRDEAVSKRRRKDLEDTHQDSWTCAELQKHLHVTLTPKSHT
jgi:hypothetical protein